MKVYLLTDNNLEGSIMNQVEGVVSDIHVAIEWRNGDMGFDFLEYELDKPDLIARIKANTGPLREMNQR